METGNSYTGERLFKCELCDKSLTQKKKHEISYAFVWFLLMLNISFFMNFEQSFAFDVC